MTIRSLVDILNDIADKANRELREILMESKTTTYGDIGWAINHVRHGHKMRRESWQKGCWIDYDKTSPSGGIVFHSTAAEVSYECSQRDMLATDWEMFEPLKPGEYHAAA